MKFLATADLHIKDDTGLSLLERLLKTAAAENCQGILIGGDLFDSPYPAASLAQQTAAVLSAAPCPVYMVAGNHDSLAETAFYQTLPQGVTLFPKEGAVYDLGGVQLVGKSSPARFCEDSPLAGLKGTGLAIGLFHGQLGGGDFQPVSAQEVAESGLSAMVLGHIHKSRLVKAGGCTVLIPGTPQGQGWDETGEKFAWILEADPQGGVDCRPVAVAEQIYLEYPLDLSACTGEEEVTAALEGLMIPQEVMVGNGKARVIGRAVLEGCLPLDPSPIADRWAARHGAEYKNNCRVGLQLQDPERLKEQNTLPGAFLRRALAELEKAPPEERPVLERAMELGLQALKEAGK